MADGAIPSASVSVAHCDTRCTGWVMSDEQIDNITELTEGFVYGRLIEAGVEVAKANHISLRAATRFKDMMKDGL